MRLLSIMKSLFRFTVYTLFAFLPLLGATSSVVAEGGTVESGASSADPSSSLDVRAGIWNDGQAAPWDLDIIDHYRYSGFPERARGYKPEQPIPFSHKLHVGDLKMECQFCHWTVAKASFAAIPEVETCVGCHNQLVIKQSEPLTKLKEYWNNNQPIPWEKVHVMPDHVRFNHKRHVKAGVSCQECHGQIPQMEVVERASSMKMGWCLDCHRQRGASIDCWTCHK